MMQTRNGSILIMCVFLVVFLVVMASSFLATMGRYRSYGMNNLLRFQADLAAEAGRTHVINTLQRHALASNSGGTPTSTNGAMDWYSSRASLPIREFEADKTLEPGGDWPYRIAANDKSPTVMNVPETDGMSGFSSSQTDRLRVQNVRSNIADNQTSPFWRVFSYTGGGGESDQIGPSQLLANVQGSRYFALRDLDEDGQPTNDPSQARYTVRYTVQVLDEDGMLSLNHQPEQHYSLAELDDPTDRLRERLAIERERYAMHLLSMMGTDSNEGSWWALTFGRLFTGYKPMTWGDGGGKHVHYDSSFMRKTPGWRKPFEQALRAHTVPFTEEEERWQELSRSLGHRGNQPRLIGHENIFNSLPYLMEGRGHRWYAGMMRQGAPGAVHNWGHVQTETFIKASTAAGPYAHGFSLHGGGLRVDAGDDCNNPWRINILNMPRNTGKMALFGGTAGVRYGNGTRLWSYQYTLQQPSMAWGGTWLTCDLLPYTEGDGMFPPSRRGGDDPRESLAANRGNSDFDDNFNVDLADAWPDHGDEAFRADNLVLRNVLDHTELMPQNIDYSNPAANPVIAERIVGGTFDAWYERLGAMRQWFYGLRGHEGKGLGPRYEQGFDDRRHAGFSGGNMPSDERWILPWYGYSRGLYDTSVVTSSSGANENMLTNHFGMAAGSFARSAQLRAGELGPDAGNGLLGSGGRDDWEGSARGLLLHEGYTFDVYEALALSVEYAAFSWGGARALDNAMQYSKTEHRAYFDDCSPIRTELKTIGDVERFFLRILGEQLDASGNAAPGALTGAPLALPSGVNWQQQFSDGWYVPSHWDHREDPDPANMEANANWKWRYRYNRYRMRADQDTTGMERLLNDVRMSFFGSTALDFNYDGVAESSAAGFDDGFTAIADRHRVLDQSAGSLQVAGGHGKTGLSSPANGSPGGNTPQQNLQVVGSLQTAVRSWRADLATWFPIRQADDGRDLGFSATGRLTMAKSVNYRIWIRGQVWDNLQNVQIAETNQELSYAVDPDRDGDVSDSHITMQRAFKNLVTFVSPGDL